MILPYAVYPPNTRSGKRISGMYVQFIGTLKQPKGFWNHPAFHPGRMVWHAITCGIPVINQWFLLTARKHLVGKPGRLRKCYQHPRGVARTHTDVAPSSRRKSNRRAASNPGDDSSLAKSTVPCVYVAGWYLHAVHTRLHVARACMLHQKSLYFDKHVHHSLCSRWAPAVRAVGVEVEKMSPFNENTLRSFCSPINGDV